jgi:hypothetical protein
MMRIVLIAVYCIKNSQAWQPTVVTWLSPFSLQRRPPSQTQRRPVGILLQARTGTTSTSQSDQQSESLDQLQKENESLRESLHKLEIENDRLLQHQESMIVLENFEGEGRLLRQIQEECSDLDGGACPIDPTVTFGEALRERAYWLVGLLMMQSGSGIILARNELLLANHPTSTYTVHHFAYLLSALYYHTTCLLKPCSSYFLFNNARGSWRKCREPSQCPCHSRLGLGYAQ